MSLRRFLSTFPAILLAFAAFLSTAQLAVAQEQESEEEMSLVTKALGAVGLLALPGPVIDYRERPPLVVPPTTTNIAPFPASGPEGVAMSVGPDGQPVFPTTQQQTVVLPPPVNPDAVRARHPDFPVDPETRAAAKAKAKKKKTGPYIMAEDPFYGGRRLRPDEMRVSGRVSNTGKVDPNGNQTGGERSSVQELNVPIITELFGKKEKPVEFTGEPPRQVLTAPPAGYLTPSPNAPYGVVSREKYVPTISGPSNSPQTADQQTNPTR